MKPTINEVIRKELCKIKGPDCESDIVSLGLLSEILVMSGKVFFSITVPGERVQEWEPLRRTAEEMVQAIEGVESVLVTLTAERQAGTASSSHGHKHTAPSSLKSKAHALPMKTKIEGVRHIVVVASGKGGVGKSTTAINLALAFRDSGFKTGLMDADIYGPSLPRLTGLVNQSPQVAEGKKLNPLEKFGLKLMSMGFLVEEEKPMVWRGPMVMSAIVQFLGDVLWAPLDVLVVDMPPGTGDVQLTIAQKVPVTGAFIVSTPQDLALIDACKAIEMFIKVKIPVLGLIENMSYFLAPDTGKRYDIFGHGGARAKAEQQGIPFLAEIPLDAVLRSSSDRGIPIFISEPEGIYAKLYRDIINQVKSKFA